MLQLEGMTSRRRRGLPGSQAGCCCWAPLLTVMGLAGDATMSASPPQTTTAQPAAPSPTVDGPYGPNQQAKAIALAAGVAEHAHPGEVDASRASARFTTTSVPEHSGPISCWTIIIPRRLPSSEQPGALTAEVDVHAADQPHAPVYLAAGARPDSVVGAANAVKPVAGSDHGIAFANAMLPPVATSADQKPLAAHALGDAPPPGTVQLPPATASGQGAPVIAAAADPSAHAAAPLSQAMPGQPRGMEPPSGAAAPFNARTAYAPPPVVVFVLVDGQAILDKPTH